MRIIEATLSLSHAPGAWQVTRVGFTPQPDRTGYSSLEDFRPINLTFFLLKIAERVVD